LRDPKTSLIIADPRELIREGLAALCDRTNQFNVVGLCADGREVLELVCLHEPAICLVALHLPTLHPFELAGLTRQTGRSTRIVILSQTCDRKTVMEALRAGASGFLVESGTVRSIVEGLGHIAKGGIYLSPEVNPDHLFCSRTPPAHSDPIERLSAREFQVFSLLVEGVRAKEIANRLNLSPKTVDSHRKNLMQKLGIHDVAGLVRFSLTRRPGTRASV
jgi:DNA-binding NarL/FixJ family response regulator